MLYPRDPSLDPQLVWKGKDEQDARSRSPRGTDLHPGEDLTPGAHRRSARDAAERSEPDSSDFFADFNGIQLRALIEFYQHDQHWTNRMILGDSLLVMASLAEKEGLKGKVQMIYIDPPYGIKFGSNWQVSTRNRDVNDGKSRRPARQPEQIRLSGTRGSWAYIHI